MTETTATPRRMKQPIKDELRRRLALAEAQLAYEQGLSLWHRLLRWWRA